MKICNPICTCELYLIVNGVFGICLGCNSEFEYIEAYLNIKDRKNV